MGCVVSRVVAIAVYLGILDFCLWHSTQSQDKCSACKGILPLFLSTCLWHSTQSQDKCSACKGILPPIPQYLFKA